MVVLINGAFGIGKTTVAGHVARRMPHSLVFNPEPIGVLFQRMHRLVGKSISDFQELQAWRRVLIWGVWLLSRFWRCIIVPMAVSDQAILAEILAGIRRSEPDIFHFCLVAPLEIVNHRLATRGSFTSPQDAAWQYRRAAECCAAHSSMAFAEHVPAGDRSPEEVAAHILRKTSPQSRAA